MRTQSEVPINTNNEVPRLQILDWQAIVEKHGPVVWQTAYRLLGNHTDAADCFQETFLAALQVAQNQTVRSLPALLTRLATTRAIDRLRQRARQVKPRCIGAEPENWDGIPTDDPEPGTNAETHELACRLRMELTKLPPLEAKAFSLRYLSDMSYREIAKELGITTTSTGALLHRAKAKLRQYIQSVTKEKNNEVVL